MDKMSSVLTNFYMETRHKRLFKDHIASNQYIWIYEDYH